jgi:hypothetical protein
MGYYFAHSPCAACGRLFAYNPHRVPSMRIKNGKLDPTGEREPICEGCMGRINADRRANGLEPFPILRGAYDSISETEW